MTFTLLRRYRWAQLDELTQRLMQDALPGEPGHDHFARSWRPRDGVRDDLWCAYGDRFPGSTCRALEEERAELLVELEQHLGRLCSLDRALVETRLPDARRSVTALRELLLELRETC